MKTNKPGDGVFQFLRAQPALPAAGQMPAEVFRAAPGQFAIGRKDQFPIGRMSVTRLHESPLDSARQAHQRPFERQSDGPQGDIENLGNFPVPETFGAQNQATAVLLGEGRDNG